MTDEIRPALTREEWKMFHEMREMGAPWSPVTYATVHPHGSAACALYGQPFGFTREDVTVLRETGEWYRDNHSGPLGKRNARVFLSLADRLAALLPPED